MSHPFLNRLISFKFNFYDEELVDIFISLLKSLALQLNSDTIKFFTNARAMHFPLFAVAMKFFNHSETMVKNAVKIIIVNILQLNDSTVNKLITDVPFVNLFTHIACYLRDKIIEIDSLHNP